MATQPRIFRAFRKVVRLNVNSPRSVRVAIIRSVPLLISGPHDLTSVEQIAACDALTIGIQVGMVMYGLALHKNKL
jgi:hypothetical protein